MNEIEKKKITRLIKKQLRYEDINLTFSKDPKEASVLEIDDPAGCANIWAHCEHNFSDVWLVGIGPWHGHYESGVIYNLIEVRRLLRDFLSGKSCVIEYLDKDDKKRATGICKQSLPDRISKDIVKFRRAFFGKGWAEEMVDFSQYYDSGWRYWSGEAKREYEKSCREYGAECTIKIASDPITKR